MLRGTLILRARCCIHQFPSCWDIGQCKNPFTLANAEWNIWVPVTNNHGNTSYIYIYGKPCANLYLFFSCLIYYYALEVELAWPCCTQQGWLPQVLMSRKCSLHKCYRNAWKCLHTWQAWVLKYIVTVHGSLLYS